MFQQEKEYLEDAYSYYQKTGERSMQYEFSKDNREKQLTIRCLDALCDDGYIQYEYRATGFCGIKLTPKGIHFVENGFQDDTVPSISGNNNIFVTGSGNTISNNYFYFADSYKPNYFDNPHNLYCCCSVQFITRRSD